MAHNITIVKTSDGRKYEEAFFAGDGKKLNPAWHGLGTNVVDAKTSKDAILFSKLDWNVSLMPVGGIDDLKDEVVRCETDSSGNSEFYAVVRDFHTAKRVLGVVGSRYSPIQNLEAFEFMDSLIEDEKLLYESAGSLKGGKIVWILARLPKIDFVTDEDTMKRYLLLCNSHDGSKAIRVITTNVRVVCNNTLTNALNKDNEGIKVRHIGNVKQKIDIASNVLKKTTEEFKEINKIEKKLASIKITKNQYKDYINILVPENDIKFTNKMQKTIRNNVLSDIQRCYNDKNQQMDTVKDTAWSAFNSYTQYIDHSSRIRVNNRSNFAESRMNNVMFENGASKKRKAFQLAINTFA